jgi:nucleoid DNA-binding protein
MNLADYLSELLVQNNEVNVPGLGYFVRERVNAYYNDKEAKFYPPYNRVKFVSQIKDDDTFTTYVAHKKNISIASSKYFTEKFVSKLKEDAAKGAFLFEGFGSFHIDEGRLIFRPNDKIAADPSFYGYPPVNINKAAPTVFIEHHKPVLTEPVAFPVITAEPVQTVKAAQYFEEEPARKKRLGIWLILLIVIATIAVALFGVYQFFPKVFDKLTAGFNQTDNKNITIVNILKHRARSDTSKTLTTVADTAPKTTSLVKPDPGEAVAADTVKSLHWAIIVDAVKKQSDADTAVNRYRKEGVDAMILPNTPGKLFKVSAGTYSTRDEAEAARLKLVNTGKISKSSYPLEIKPQK